MKKLVSIVLAGILLANLCACSISDIRERRALREQPDSSVVQTQPDSEPQEEATPDPAPAASEEPVVPSGGIRQEFKDLLASYEAFFDEYVLFMQDYYQNSSSLEMLVKYAEFLSKYSEAMEALEEIEEEDLSDEEEIYYAEVMLRISQKLLTVAEN
ncbi:MAG: hypothetical protein IJU18_00505 [Oscillospiraceae bacterium]|nr:hypothetical protein [Oscillospiraceae bacterium]